MRARNIIITCLCSAIFTACCADKATELFNGKNLEGWEGVVEGDSVPASEVFTVQDGCIAISGMPFGYIYTKETYSDYVIEAQWKWVGEPTNSGIFLNIQDLTNPFPNCVECNLMAGNAGDFVILGGASLEEYVEPEGGRTTKFPKMVKFEESSEKPAGEWNDAKIEVKDGHIKVYINGVFQNEGTDPCKEGHIALQSEGGPVLFRNIKLTKLK